MDLHADSVQGVIFLAPGQQQQDAMQLWNQSFGGDGPDGFQRAAASPSLLSTATGDRNGHHVTINAQVGRIDIILNAPSAAIATAGAPPRIADVNAAAAQVADWMREMAVRAKLVRVAIVQDLAKTVARNSGSSDLIDLLPSFPFPRNSTDVVMQFNSRKPFESVPDLEMNRLCTWQSGQVGFLSNSPAQGSGMMIMSPFIGLKIDVNSSPEGRPQADKISGIIDEILAESAAIFADGVTRFTA